MEPERIFKKAESGRPLNREELKTLLTLEKEDDVSRLLEEAYRVKLAAVGKKVYFRGIIEFSNICEKNCLYCGIRRDNGSVERYELPEEAVLAAAEFASSRNYGSVVIQAGERSDEGFVSTVEKLLKKIKKASSGKLGITLSLGEQSEEAYRRWFEAGAHRYLLRIETSSRELYKRLHPKDHSFDGRRKCLELLKSCGYQVGTGVMIRLPFQTYDDLAGDLLFFREADVAMIGMGPYLPSGNTPFGKLTEKDFPISEDPCSLAIKMIAVARVFLRDVNIASTTALQALNPKGREMGLKAGANIIMPNITETRFRPSYQLYDNKPSVDENAVECVKRLEEAIAAVGEEIGYGEWGDSPHFGKKK